MMHNSLKNLWKFRKNTNWRVIFYLHSWVLFKSRCNSSINQKTTNKSIQKADRNLSVANSCKFTCLNLCLLNGGKIAFWILSCTLDVLRKRDVYNYLNLLYERSLRVVCNNYLLKKFLGEIVQYRSESTHCKNIRSFEIEIDKVTNYIPTQLVSERFVKRNLNCTLHFQTNF